MKRKFAHTLFLILIVGHSYSQDSIPVAVNQQEEKLLSFQEHFFEALAQKAILKFAVAIEHLEKCNELKPNSVSVLFELSKNYSLLNKTIEAVSYAKQALKLEPNNRWVLEHLFEIYLSEKNNKAAIELLEIIAQSNPGRNEQLVLLYFENDQAKKGKELLMSLQEKQLLTPNLKKLLSFSKEKQTTPKTSVVGVKSLSSLLKAFNSSQSFENLQKILRLSEKEDAAIFLAYAKKGVELFPAQSFVYLAYAKALNKEKSYKKSLETLQNGIDFVIDNTNLEADFYLEMSFSYEGLGNKEAALAMKNKSLALRTIK